MKEKHRRPRTDPARAEWVALLRLPTNVKSKKLRHAITQYRFQRVLHPVLKQARERLMDGMFAAWFEGQAG